MKKSATATMLIPTATDDYILDVTETADGFALELTDPSDDLVACLTVTADWLLTLCHS